MYYLNGIHFINNIIFDRTNRYNNLLFFSTISNLNKALKYLYFHSSQQFCGTETLLFNLKTDNEYISHSVGINVTC